MKKLIAATVTFTFLLAAAMPLGAETRTFNDVFPNINETHKDQVFNEGLIRSIKKNETFQFFTANGSGIDLISKISGKKFNYYAESLLVIPYTGRQLTNLDTYNALGKVRGLKGKLYSSHSKNAEIPLFEDATRLDSKKTNSIPDPPPALSVPSSETIYLRLKDTNFGNTYYQADITRLSEGILYSLSNYKTISYLLFTVMKENRFNALLYMEPLKEGILVYSVAGAEVSDFIAGRISIPSAISKRLGVFIGWVSDGITSAK